MVINIDIPSAKTMDHHTPSIPHNNGKKQTKMTCKITVLSTDKNADIKPLFKAVNILEPKIPIPLNTKDMEKILNA